MAQLNWGKHGVVTTEESISLFQEDQHLFEIWTVQASSTGIAAPVRLDNQIGTSFLEALSAWATLNELEESFDPLSLTYNGLPLVDSRQAAAKLAMEYNNSSN